MTIENLKIIGKLLEDYSNFIENRSNVYLIVLDNIFPKILEWHFYIWQKEYELLGKDHDLNEWSNYNQISATLDGIFKKVEERALKEGNSYSFFRAFEKHIERNKEVFIEGAKNKFYYVESIMPIFYSTLVENIKNSKERHDIWGHYFPIKWKITKDNIEDQKNIISRALLHYFLDWARERFWQSEDEKEYDGLLDEIATNLFPSVEPILWAKLLTILMRSWVNDNRMKSLIELGTNFGLFSRIFVSFDSTENQLHDLMATQEKVTMELVLFLFGNYFTKDTLNNFIKDLNELKYDQDSKEEKRRHDYITIFNKLIQMQN